MLYEEATLAKVPVSLATVYNTLNQLTEAGLLRQVSVDGTSLGLRLVKTAIPMPNSGTSVISVPQPGQPPP